MERFFKRPWLIVAVVALITAFFALQLPRAKMDNNNFRFVPRNDPERLSSVRIDDVFGSNLAILVGLERRSGSILEAEFLEKLRGFCARIEELPGVESATSVMSADYIDGTEEGISVEPLVPESFAGTQDEIVAIRDRLLGWDLYRRALVSDDLTATQVVASLDFSADDAGTAIATDVYRNIKRIALETGFPSTNVYVTGIPVFSGVVNDATRADLVVLVPLVIVVVLLTLFLSFRRAGGIVLPLLTVAVSAILAIGAMAMFGVKLSIITTILPVILVAVGSAYGIHVVSHYYDEMAGKRNLSDAEHREIVFGTLRKIGQPVLLAALTTFAGFGSLCFTSVVPIFEFGLFASFGVIVAFVVSLTLIPALLLIRGPDRKNRDSAAFDGPTDPLSAAFADALGTIARKKRTTIFV